MVNQEDINQYDFIMNPGSSQQKASRLPTNPKTKRLLAILFLLAIVVIATIVLISIFSSVDKSAKADWATALQQQTEIIRVSEIGVKKAKDSDAKNLAITTQLSLASSQPTLSSLANKSGVKLDSKQLKAGQDDKTDLRLTQAEQTNQFDSVFNQTLKAQLADYQLTIKRLYEASESQATRLQLNSIYQSAGLLITSK